MVTSIDMPAPVRHLHNFEASLANTEKHIQLEIVSEPETAHHIIKIERLQAEAKEISRKDR
jgi:trimethylamine:corrinoid methyltransferase-like protein